MNDFLQGLEIADFIIGDALLPTTKENADPFVSQGADDDPVSFLVGFVHLVEGASPKAMADRFVGILDEALVNKEPRKRSGLRFFFP